MQEYLTHSEAETEQAGADFARALPDGREENGKNDCE